MYDWLAPSELLASSPHIPASDHIHWHVECQYCSTFTTFHTKEGTVGDCGLLDQGVVAVHSPDRAERHHHAGQLLHVSL
jgi:hypothetical protein